MALRKRGKYEYGDAQADIRLAIRDYSQGNTYLARHFADALCACGSTHFKLRLDDTAGAAERECVACGRVHPIGDSADYLDEAELDDCACPCGNEELEVTAGVALYQGSRDVRWLYLGCRCPRCGITAVYGDWKNEFDDYRELLRQV